jgi:hypothetical protein
MISHGILDAALAPGETTVFDRVNTLTVKMISGVPSSATEAQIRADAELNPFWVLGDKGWEMGQFTTVTALGNDRYALTLLRRGRRNTENYMTDHVQGVPILFPTANTVTIQDFGASEIDLANPASTFFRAVEATGIARPLVEHEIVGRSKRPYSPTKIAGSVTANDWTVTWERRSRDGKSLSLSTVPIGEDIHDYVVEILDGPGGDVVNTYTSTATANGSVVTVSANGGQLFYDDQDQIADFTAVQSTIHVRVYQLSSLVTGFRGEPKEETLSI